MAHDCSKSSKRELGAVTETVINDRQLRGEFYCGFTDTPGLLYTSLRWCDMLAIDYNSHHLLLAWMSNRAAVERKPGEVSPLPAYKSRISKAFSDTSRGLRRD